MMIRYLTILILLSLSFVTIKSQQGGTSTYDFLNLPNSARIAGLGGNHVGVPNSDLNLWYHNPSLLNSRNNGQIVINYVPYLSDVRYGFTAYSQHIKNIGTWAVGVHNINYGNFVAVNENSEILGTFKAAEYAAMFGFARQLTPNISAGITFKPIFSHFESYSSFGIAGDLGSSYQSDDKLFAAGIVLKNFGSQITNYNGTNEPLPTDLQLGFSQKLEHAPFRFLLTFQGLLEWDLDYKVDDSQNGSAYANNNVKSLSFGDNFLRHTIFGVEFLPTKTFFVTLGYNHRRRQELKLVEKPSLTGYSWGFGLKLYKFNFAYGSARYHLSGSSNHFSITANMSDFGL